MAKRYEHNAVVSFANRIAVFAMKIGIAPKYQFILSVQGRKSKRIYSTPVYVMEDNSKQLLVSPYGEVSWVRNARASGKITLTKGAETKEYRINELGLKESAPILKKYLALAPITQPYFDAKPDAPIETFLAEASKHPVFELNEIYSQVIQDYIAEYKKQKFPWSIYGADNYLDIPNISISAPENYLPLMLISWLNGSNNHMLGIDINGNMLFSYISCVPTRSRTDEIIWELNSIQLYPNMNALFSDALNRGFYERNPETLELVVGDIYMIYLLETYRRLVKQVRLRFPKIKHLLIDAPELSPEMKKAFQEFEKLASAF